MVLLPCRLTSIVPLAPLDRLLSTCFRYHSPVLDVSWVKVHKLDLSSAAFCIRSASLCDTCYERDVRASRNRTILSRRENRLSKATRYARCHPIGSKGHGGDVCIHRPAVFRSNKSLSLRFFFGKSMLALVPLYRPFFRLLLPFSPETSFILSVFLDLTTCLQKDSHARRCHSYNHSRIRAYSFTFLLRYIIINIFRHRKE